MTNRTFGVEIECGTPWDNDYYDGDYEDYCCAECNGTDVVGKTDEFLSWHGFGSWCEDIHMDGTSVEISSPILCGEQGLNELRSIMKLLNEHGFYVTDEDGLHVHHDGADFIGNTSLVSRLVESWAANQENIDLFVPEYRRGNYWACESWHPQKLERFRKDVEEGLIGGYQRGNLNIDALRSHGTIEIRQHEGTLDADQAVAWVRFGQQFIERVVSRKTPMTCADSAGALLKTLRVAESAQLVLRQKAGIEEVAA